MRPHAIDRRQATLLRLALVEAHAEPRGVEPRGEGESGDPAADDVKGDQAPTLLQM
ncbi:hypothetical protein GCM10028815_23990 [Mariniluteicoccus flavus]